VTGGSRGIGRAICLAFARAGWRVVVHFLHRQDEAQGTVALIKDLGGEGSIFQADIRDGEQVETMVRDIAARWDQLDVMVCNAGQASSQLALRTSPEVWTATIEANLTGTYHCLKAAGRAMLPRRRGSVIVVGSLAGVQGRRGLSAYTASKAGLLGLVKTAAREWGPDNVRVNAVFPGWHRTELSGSAVPKPIGLADHVLGRTADLAGIARAIYHLALLEDASGQVWNLDSRIF
jgi:3-oxoacyl-[acyl-carrier protein] reductase